MKELTEELRKSFERVSTYLSPENLTCDGELWGAAVTRRRTRLRLEWRALEKEAGRRVSEAEVWGEE